MPGQVTDWYENWQRNVNLNDYFAHVQASESEAAEETSTKEHAQRNCHDFLCQGPKRYLKPIPSPPGFFSAGRTLGKGTFCELINGAFR
ncbi:hypothetical protein A9Q83_15030 [Alphaproteobacteria bacterium 46_93_T64]|nr:hypothetical protein A9Q83_15030 [Alphaproteobacteria bacterium 46_93_T64]